MKIEILEVIEITIESPALPLIEVEEYEVLECRL